MVLNLLQIISVLLGIVGLTLLVPIGVAVAVGETSVILSFVVPLLASAVFFLLIRLISFKRKKIDLSIRSTFFIVAVAWLSASIFGALPLFLSGAIPSWTDAVFESVSGFSTTGATILGNGTASSPLIENLPRSINLWRCMTHWLGGMGIVALTVALLPLLGVGGFQLIKAETTGPEKSKITSKITTTAKVLWLIYFILTALEAILLRIFGMDTIDAISHAFATLGTGGFSTKNASIAGYDSAAIDIICTVFMFLAGVNFSMFFYIVTRKTDEIKENSELKAYCAITFVAIAFLTLATKSFYGSFAKALRFSAFQAVSITTTTGFGTADYTLWPSAAQFFIFVLFFIGGCSGSTGGGIKVIRWVVLFKQINNETNRIIHPHGVFNLRLNGKPTRSDIVFNVVAFFTIYLVAIFVTTFVGTVCHLDLWTAFTGAISMIGNVGPAFGALGPSCNYAFLPAFLKWWYCIMMIAGRLELYTIIIFFMPAYWRK